ncbi:ParA family protein [Streptomyces sp. rh34]|uniref:ParA family protein n=1 Tax=Streptomyces sp. rh34 TaxID=2034272 RepID=UPI000BEFCD3E|nr:ParA family protein [Streptomyces sp. rh34]
MADEAVGEVDVVGALKGGVGKTRFAMLAALYLATIEGEDVAYVDGDSVSQTGNDWAKDYARETGKPFPVKVTRHPFDDVDELAADLRRQHRRVIIDVGGGNPAVFAAALTHAKRLVVPIGADPSEIRRLRVTWKAAQMAAAESEVGGFDAWVLLSRTDHSTSLPGEYRTILTAGRDEATGRELPVYPLLAAEMRKRVAYQRAYSTVPGDFLDVPKVMSEVGMIPALDGGRS